MFSFWKKPVPVREMTTSLPRAELIQRSRIAVLDDEAPEMLQDITAQGFSVDHLRSTADERFKLLEIVFYDVLLLDYGGIGQNLGPDEGLDILRHLKRVNPALHIIAFTGRTFDASKADFFRMCDGVIKKDAGIREILEELESHLQRTLTPAFHWNALCASLHIDVDSPEAHNLERELQKALRKQGGKERFLRALKMGAKLATGNISEAIADKTFDLAFRWITNETQ